MAALMQKILRTNIPLAVARPTLLTASSKGGQLDTQPRRGFPTQKHWDLKWRQLRKKKVMKVELPKIVELKRERKNTEDRTLDEIRKDMKKEGRLPPRTFQELPLNTSCTRSIIEPFKPPEGDGKHSLLSGSLSENYNRMMKGPRSLKHVRRIKKYEDFDEAQFAGDAKDIVVEAQTLLQDVYKNQDRLHELVTEKAFPEMVHGLETKTMRWKLVEMVEPPNVVQIRAEDMITKDNVFAQVTVRFHSKQILAIYDRFGRLMYGDPLLPKSVVEYVVFEKWISDTYGTWRIHGKIIPDWMETRDAVITTYKMPTFDPLPPPTPSDGGDGKGKSKEDGEETDVENEDKSTPKLAAA